MAYKINDYNFISTPAEHFQLQVDCGKKIYEFTVKDTHDYEMLLNYIKKNYEEFNHRIAKKIIDEFKEILMYNLIIKEKRDLIIDKGRKACETLRDMLIDIRNCKIPPIRVLELLDDAIFYLKKMYQWGWYTKERLNNELTPLLEFQEMFINFLNNYKG